MVFAHKPINNKGFNLLELLIVIVIIAILMGVAYPSYQSHVMKVRRVDGQTALLTVASQLEKYALTSQSGYADATLARLSVSPISPEGYYQLVIINADTQHYIIAATPLGAQIKDTTCNSLAMDDQGRKGRLQGSSVVMDKSCW